MYRQTEQIVIMGIKLSLYHNRKFHDPGAKVTELGRGHICHAYRENVINLSKFSCLLLTIQQTN